MYVFDLDIVSKKKIKLKKTFTEVVELNNKYNNLSLSSNVIPYVTACEKYEIFKSTTSFILNHYLCSQLWLFNIHNFLSLKCIVCRRHRTTIFLLSFQYFPVSFYVFIVYLFEFVCFCLFVGCASADSFIAQAIITVHCLARTRTNLSFIFNA